MEQQTNNSSSGLLGLQQKNEFLAVLDSLFPDQDLSNEKSKYRKKADLAFDLMIQQEWTVEQFQATMAEFSLKWTYNTWMPAHLFEIKSRLFWDPGMII